MLNSIAVVKNKRINEMNYIYNERERELSHINTVNRMYMETNVYNEWTHLE